MTDDAEARCQAAGARIRAHWAELVAKETDPIKLGIDDAEMEANWPMGDK